MVVIDYVYVLISLYILFLLFTAGKTFRIVNSINKGYNQQQPFSSIINKIQSPITNKQYPQSTIVSNRIESVALNMTQLLEMEFSSQDNCDDFSIDSENKVMPLLKAKRRKTNKDTPRGIGTITFLLCFLLYHGFVSVAF